jgi:hypothetical protein
MNSAEYVSNQIAEMKLSGIPLSEAAWKTALLCVGWAYVFGARGEYCSPANRRSYYKSKGDEHPTIKTACKGFDSGNCSGCKWYPSGKRTRFFDCRGFTYWVLLQVYGWKLMGAGATSQWNNADNWKAKGTIDTMPKDTLCCLFVQKGKTMSHTGFGLNNETVECSSGVQHFTTRNKKWTHWGVPACIDDTPTPTPEPTPDKKPTLKRGSKGEYVTLAQTELINKGYSCGSFGADGEFGAATEAAVKKFQKDNGLTVDGIIGEKTWAALDQQETPTKYTVVIPHLSNSQADALIRQYPDATKTEERG